LTKIKLILCGIVLLLWMRLGFTITHQNSNGSQNSGQKPVVQHQDKVGSISSKGHGIGDLDAKGILFTDYLENGKTITEEYYSSF
jgi:hypothetical protein